MEVEIVEQPLEGDLAQAIVNIRNSVDKNGNISWEKIQSVSYGKPPFSEAEFKVQSGGMDEINSHGLDILIEKAMQK